MDPVVDRRGTAGRLTQIDAADFEEIADLPLRQANHQIGKKPSAFFADAPRSFGRLARRDRLLEATGDFLKLRDTDRRLTGAVAKLSEEAFRRVWDNPDDADYDRL